MRRCARSILMGLVATALAGVTLIPTAAEEPVQPKSIETPAKPEAPAARKGYDPVRRVPPHFAKVGLTPEQREQIYKVRAQHLERIDRLRRELVEQHARMMAESEGVLTDAQKTLLEEHRRGAAKAREKKAGAATLKVDAR